MKYYFTVYIYFIYTLYLIQNSCNTVNPIEDCSEEQQKTAKPALRVKAQVQYYTYYLEQ